MELIEPHPFRLTKIVCTIGPSSLSPDVQNSMAANGMNIARINLSHGTQEQHMETVRNIRTLSSGRGADIGILFDTRGAAVRTGDVREPIIVTKGQEVFFVPKQIARTSENIPIIEVGYDGFAKDVLETDRIVLDNGSITFDILSISKDGIVRARSMQDGSIGSRRHINLPGADIDLPAVTESDWKDITLATQSSVDYISLSFIRNAEEVQAVRAFLAERKSNIQLITKIETLQAIENLTEIINASDGVMVARGDLGAEVPYEQLPILQHSIVEQCRDSCKPVIVATHMLESMKDYPIPTRAEVTDVAHAGMQQTDATMLSGETASGRDPPLAIDAMDRILRVTETYASRFTDAHAYPIRCDEDERASVIVSDCEKSKAGGILILSEAQELTRYVSKFRPKVPIFIVSDDAQKRRALALCYGVFACSSVGNDERASVAAFLQGRDILLPGASLYVIGKNSQRVVSIS